MFPLSYGYFNQRLNLIPLLLALLLSGTSLGAMTLNKLAGENFQMNESFHCSFPLFLGIVMDDNPKHFPTILTMCIIMAIILYIISHVVYFFHQRKRVNKDETSVVELT